jgi:hypothetical protein
VSCLGNLSSGDQLLPDIAIHPFFIYAEPERRNLRKRKCSLNTPR